LKRLPFLLTCLFLSGCASHQLTAVADHDNIAEAVFRHMCQPEPVEKDVSPSAHQAHEVYFLSFGDSTDPNPEFLRRFSDFKIPVKPISAGVWRGRLIYDKVSGEGGAAFYVKDILMLSQDEAEVVAVIHPEGGLSASGLVYRVYRKSGKWTVISENIKWIS
jgi:hypothetical protein